jgi:hypothetical protein
VTDPAALLTAARSGDPVARNALSDWLRERDSDPAADAALALACERCRVPDGTERVCRDRFGGWHVWDRVHAMNSSDGSYLFGDVFPAPLPAPVLASYHDGTRWHLVCPDCRRSLVAHRAARTRKDRRERAAPTLFPE